MATQKETMDALLERFGPEIAKAFQAATDDIKAQADLSRLIQALAKGDIVDAIAALHLDPVAYNELLDAVEKAYAQGGAELLATLPDNPDSDVVVRFNVRNPRAEMWLRRHSAELVTRIIEEQKTLIRTALEEALAEGRAPRSAALDIVGRLNTATGKREGGVIGLTAPQERFVASARAELASADPKALNHYLTRTRRDKRYDPTIRKAIAQGKPVPAAIRQKAGQAYERRLLQLRGETIGRTEAMTSLQSAKLEGARQLVDSGAATANMIRRVWRASGLKNTRDSHLALHGETVGLEEPWISPVTGAAIMYPGDPAAPAGERINCRCDQFIRVDYFANLR